MKWIKKLWAGGYPLWKAYWLFSFVGGYIAFGIFLFTQTKRDTIFLWPRGEQLYWAIVVFLTAYIVLSLVGVWRSAGHYSGPRHWVKWARSIVAVNLGLLAAWVGMWFLPRPITEDSIAREAYTRNLGLPIMVDKRTRLDRIEATGMTYAEYYSSLAIPVDRLDVEYFETTIIGRFTGMDCEDNRDYLEAGVVFRYVFADQNGDTITDFTVKLSDCSG